MDRVANCPSPVASLIWPSMLIAFGLDIFSLPGGSGQGCKTDFLPCAGHYLEECHQKSLLGPFAQWGYGLVRQQRKGRARRDLKKYFLILLKDQFSELRYLFRATGTVGGRPENRAS